MTCNHLIIRLVSMRNKLQNILRQKGTITSDKRVQLHQTKRCNYIRHNGAYFRIIYMKANLFLICSKNLVYGGDNHSLKRLEFKS